MAAQEEKVRKILHPLVESLRQGLGQNLIAVVLFGSRARGEATVESDWESGCWLSARGPVGGERRAGVTYQAEKIASETPEQP